MTKQQYIKKESEEAYKNGTYMRPVIDGFAYGLSKGLEICIQIIQDYETYSLSKEEATIILEKYYLTENEKK